ncbi:hypothetical protein DS832_07085 [Bombilactobacillus bombi]|uniref:Uncharacterized protein n=1 Tax=Bombilactobacillus bombi TaxID=1303590 RepID=A0A3R6Z8X9_9LACO|nr:hypothetical protein [Bombilactobacillus bombi]RHW46106.1 hypothetical protein DS832_07085 [Bombilactobacillus bombi]
MKTTKRNLNRRDVEDNKKNDDGLYSVKLDRELIAGSISHVINILSGTIIEEFEDNVLKQKELDNLIQITGILLTINSDIWEALEEDTIDVKFKEPKLQEQEFEESVGD